MTPPALPVIRKASPDDLDALCALNRDLQALHHQYLPQRFKPSSEDPAFRAHFEGVLANPNSAILLALLEEEVVGYAVYEIKTTPETAFTYASTSLYIHHVAVKPSFQNRGIGKSLMEALESAARDRGVDCLQLDFWSFNEQARAFYQRLGYHAYNERWCKPLR